jgi:NAD(P)H-flavin reductase/hemoglobin-like flavoprotein
VPSAIKNTYSDISPLSRENLAAGTLPRTESPLARTESVAPPTKSLDTSVVTRDFDSQLVKESFARMAAEAPVAMEYFYARLFAASSETRALFPMSMITQRQRMFAALSELVWVLDDEHGCTRLLGELGRGHRSYGVTDRHYALFFEALRDTAEHFGGEDWLPATAAAWDAALGYMAAAMRAAAAADAAVRPPWWVAEIVGHELRSPGVAVLTLQPSQPVPYQAGQYVPVQVTRWPRVWRPYSIANAPRPGGLIDLHVRAVPGGLVSNALVYHSVAGDAVLLGPATGGMTLQATDRDLLCIAGGTGLAPVKAVIEQAIATARSGRQRKITLFVGARQHFDLYDLPDLQLLEAAWPALRVIPVLSDEPGFSGLTGLLPDVVHASLHGMFDNAEAYVCGPAAMVRQTAALLAASLPAAQIHHDPLP